MSLNIDPNGEIGPKQTSEQSTVPTASDHLHNRDSSLDSDNFGYGRPVDVDDQKSCKAIWVVLVALAVIGLVALIALLQPSTPNKIQSGGGTGYFPLYGVTAADLQGNLAPLTRNQESKVTVTKSQAEADAEKAISLSLTKATAATVDEGSFTGQYQRNTAAFVVIFYGPGFDTRYQAHSTLAIVVISANNGESLQSAAYSGQYFSPSNSFLLGG
jgi:hypothetical protein